MAAARRRSRAAESARRSRRVARESEPGGRRRGSGDRSDLESASSGGGRPASAGENQPEDPLCDLPRTTHHDGEKNSPGRKGSLGRLRGSAHSVRSLNAQSAAARFFHWGGD